MRFSTKALASLPLLVSFSAVSLPSFAVELPTPTNSLAALLEKACLNEACISGYRVHFRQTSFEAKRRELTVYLTLQANQGIVYPVLTDSFEGQLTQSSFTGVCKIREVASDTELVNGDQVDAGFLASTASCLQALSAKTDRALARD